MNRRSKKFVPGSKAYKFVVAIALAAVSAPVLASDFYALIVLMIAFGISVILLIQALVGIALVINKRYVSKDPTLFIVIAVAFLLIGTATVLGEADHLNSGDLMVFFAAMFVPGVLAIIPPLIQRVRARH